MRIVRSELSNCRLNVAHNLIHLRRQDGLHVLRCAHRYAAHHHSTRCRRISRKPANRDAGVLSPRAEVQVILPRETRRFVGLQKQTQGNLESTRKPNDRREYHRRWPERVHVIHDGPCTTAKGTELVIQATDLT